MQASSHNQQGEIIDMKVLVINAGSSSLKYQLMDTDTRDVLAKGLCERIGIDGRLTHKVPAKDLKHEADIPMPTHAEAIQSVLDALLSDAHGVIRSVSEIDAVGHRVVHGGEEFAGSVFIDGAVMGALEKCIPLAPPQPRQHHRHQGLPVRHARRAHGGRVRHRLPSDHAGARLPLRPAL